MKLPMIHLGGSSAEFLMELNSAAVYALTEAIAKLREAYPHARDFYPQREPDAYAEASAEHDARLAAVQKVADEMTAIWQHCYDAVEAKKARSR